MVLDRHEEEPETVEELDAAERRDAHVQEDAEDDRVGHEPEQRGQEDGKPHQHGDAEPGDALICPMRNQR